MCICIFSMKKERHAGTTSKLSIKMRRKAPWPTILIQLTTKEFVCLNHFQCFVTVFVNVLLNSNDVSWTPCMFPAVYCTQLYDITKIFHL